MLILQEHTSSKYTPRTYFNAKKADLTVAFAADFTTAGEKCTHKAAGEAYLPIWIFTTPLLASRELYKALKAGNVKVLNIAGNGIYTLEQYDISQSKANQYLYEVIRLVHKHWPIEEIISGGQTGVDLAGLVVANRLGINCVGTFPKGFIQRGTDKVDKTNLEADIRAEILSMSEVLEDRDTMIGWR